MVAFTVIDMVNGKTPRHFSFDYTAKLAGIVVSFPYGMLQRLIKTWSVILLRQASLPPRIFIAPYRIPYLAPPIRIGRELLASYPSCLLFVSICPDNAHFLSMFRALSTFKPRFRAFLTFAITALYFWRSLILTNVRLSTKSTAFRMGSLGLAAVWAFIVGHWVKV